MTPLALYEALRDEGCDFGVEDGRFYVAAYEPVLKRYKAEIDRCAGALRAIVNEFSEPSDHSVIRVIDVAHDIVAGAHGGADVRKDSR